MFYATTTDLSTCLRFQLERHMTPSDPDAMASSPFQLHNILQDDIYSRTCGSIEPQVGALPWLLRCRNHLANNVSARIRTRKCLTQQPAASVSLPSDLQTGTSASSNLSCWMSSGVPSRQRTCTLCEFHNDPERTLHRPSTNHHLQDN